MIADVAQHPVRQALLKLWAPVPWMLEAAIVLQLGIGRYAEAGIVALLLLTNTALGFFQEGRAQATLDALKSRLALVASVRRDGSWTKIPVSSLVVGDVVKLSLGCVVPADIRLDEGSVPVDQSMLTRESIPVEGGPAFDALAGALIRRGEAIGQVTATGARTKFGRAAELVGSAKVESSQQKAILAVVRNLAIYNGGVTVLLTAYALWLPLPRDEIVPLVLVALLSSVPMALPAMFTLAAAVGARALARQGVLPTSLSAVDEAAGIDVLIADKTGTLTRNELVKALQADGHVVGMCGDGANDAPALRQAQMGVAVSTATDVAKSAAGIVLTEPGLTGVVAAVREGRITYQRILTYTLRSLIHKVVQVMFLAMRLVMTGQAILTPTPMVLRMVTGDVLAMSSSTDNVRPSPLPSVWHIGPMTIAGIVLGIVDLVFCVLCLASGKFLLGLDTGTLRTLTVVTLVFGGQAVLYVARERRHFWSSKPGDWLLASSAIDILIVSGLALHGWLMDPLPPLILGGLAVAALVFALVLDAVKALLVRSLRF